MLLKSQRVPLYSRAAKYLDHMQEIRLELGADWRGGGLPVHVVKARWRDGGSQKPRQAWEVLTHRRVDLFNISSFRVTFSVQLLPED